MTKRSVDPDITTSIHDRASFFIGCGLTCDLQVREKEVLVTISSLHTGGKRHYRYPLDSEMRQHFKYLRMNFPLHKGKVGLQLAHKGLDPNEVKYRRAVYDYLQLLPCQLNLINPSEGRCS